VSTDDRAAVIIQAVGELGRGLGILDQEVRTRQWAAARDTVAQLHAVLAILDQAAGQAPLVQLCSQCGAVADPGKATCWRHG
jgi:hypothetical protein